MCKLFTKVQERRMVGGKYINEDDLKNNQPGDEVRMTRAGIKLIQKGKTLDELILMQRTGK